MERPHRFEPNRFAKDAICTCIYRAVKPPCIAALKSHPDLRRQYLKTLQVLVANPTHPSLRLHPLRGKMDGLHSVSINLSVRNTPELLIQDEHNTPFNVVQYTI